MRKCVTARLGGDSDGESTRQQGWGPESDPGSISGRGGSVLSGLPSDLRSRPCTSLHSTENKYM